MCLASSKENNKKANVSREEWERKGAVGDVVREVTGALDSPVLSFAIRTQKGARSLGQVRSSWASTGTLEGERSLPLVFLNDSEEED